MSGERAESDRRFRFRLNCRNRPRVGLGRIGLWVFAHREGASAMQVSIQILVQQDTSQGQDEMASTAGTGDRMHVSAWLVLHVDLASGGEEG